MLIFSCDMSDSGTHIRRIHVLKTCEFEAGVHSTRMKKMAYISGGCANGLLGARSSFVFSHLLYVFMSIYEVKIYASSIIAIFV